MTMLLDLDLSPYEREAWLLTGALGFLALVSIVYMEFVDHRRRHLEHVLVLEAAQRLKIEEKRQKASTTTTTMFRSHDAAIDENDTAPTSPSISSTTITTSSTNSNNNNRDDNNFRSDSINIISNSDKNANLKLQQEQLRCLYRVIRAREKLGIKSFESYSKETSPEPTYLDFEKMLSNRLPSESDQWNQMAGLLLFIVRELHGLEAADFLFGGALSLGDGVGDSDVFFNRADLSLGNSSNSNNSNSNSNSNSNDKSNSSSNSSSNSKCISRLLVSTDRVKFNEFFRSDQARYDPARPKTLPIDLDEDKLLSEVERRVLDSFKERLGPAICSDPNMDLHACLRFLRARKWDVDGAVLMAQDWFRWFYLPLSDPDNGRLSGSAGSRGDACITPANISAKQYVDINEETFTELCPHTNSSEDKEGSPIYWELTGEISSGFNEVISQLQEDHLINRHIRQQELMMEACRYQSLKHNKLIEKQVVVFNLANLDMSVNLTALSVFKKTLQVDQNYYPERLKRFIMVNSPWFFSSIWSLIKGFIDPNTAQKFQIVGSDFLPLLRQFIDDDQIPDFYGGSLKTLGGASAYIGKGEINKSSFWGHPYPKKSHSAEETLLRLNDRIYYSTLYHSHKGALGQKGGESRKEVEEEAGLVLELKTTRGVELQLSSQVSLSHDNGHSDSTINSKSNSNSSKKNLLRAPTLFLVRFDPFASFLHHSAGLEKLNPDLSGSLLSEAPCSRYRLLSVYVPGINCSSFVLYKSGDRWFQHSSGGVGPVNDPFEILNQFRNKNDSFFGRGCNFHDFQSDGARATGILIYEIIK